MNYSLYEFLKRAYVAAHPDATPEDYQAAMKRFAKECGV